MKLIWCILLLYFEQAFSEYARNNSYVNTISADANKTTNDPNCSVPATCRPLSNNFCFGSKLPYNSTSFSLVSGIVNEEDAHEKLLSWKRLSTIPKCWSLIQFYLCALYLPECESGSVTLPTKDMCEKIESHCGILKTKWPKELCNSSLLSNSSCQDINKVSKMKFNTFGQCERPLVSTEQESLFYDGIEGCGIQCNNTLFTNKERQEIRTIVIYGSFLAFIFSLFAVLTFVIDWKTTKTYPSQAVFCINICFLMVSLGYLYQFRPGAGDSTVCNEDGTRRSSEPRINKNLSCVTSFVFVYYFLIAGIVWFVICAYSWELSSRTVGITRMDKKNSPYYHLIAWSLPLVLTITVMTLSGVDGDSLFGICFVGVDNKRMRVIFFLIPLCLGLLGCCFFIKGLVTLFRLKVKSTDVISKNANAKIRINIIRALAISAFILLFGSIIIICNWYEILNYQSWEEGFRSYLVCKVNIVDNTDPKDCKLPSGSVLVAQLQLLAQFGIHVVMSLWLWTNLTVETWKNFFLKLFNKAEEKQVPLKIHQIISNAFNKRKGMTSECSQFSITICNPKYPVDLNFELNSSASSVSYNWFKILPYFMKRRNAITIEYDSNSSNRRNSGDSEISHSVVRRVSIESRRHSLDSTVSVTAQTLEVKKTVLKRPTDKRRSQRKHRKREADVLNKTSSEDSNLEKTEEILKAVNINIYQGGPNMDRRGAKSGVEMEETLKFFTGKLVDECISLGGRDSEYDEMKLDVNEMDVFYRGELENSDLCTDSDDDSSANEDESFIV